MVPQYIFLAQRCSLSALIAIYLIASSFFFVETRRVSSTTHLYNKQPTDDTCYCTFEKHTHTEATCHPPEAGQDADSKVRQSRTRGLNNIIRSVVMDSSPSRLVKFFTFNSGVMQGGHRFPKTAGGDGLEANIFAQTGLSNQRGFHKWAEVELLKKCAEIFVESEGKQYGRWTTEITDCFAVSRAGEENWLIVPSTWKISVAPAPLKRGRDSKQIPETKTRLVESMKHNFKSMKKKRGKLYTGGGKSKLLKAGDRALSQTNKLSMQVTIGDNIKEDFQFKDLEAWATIPEGSGLYQALKDYVERESKPVIQLRPIAKCENVMSEPPLSGKRKDVSDQGGQVSDVSMDASDQGGRVSDVSLDSL
eukprot:TRINITY_DN13178_c0_g1_i2.p1 TRINITY_DN13178_c0_g1~~TRINITY_DN13178_c0_g1_i2.p1  ORF type:complete len:363 (-),score=23.93 TRINITY_DN13178_c0_g1_i2:86-1174(-)